MDQQHAFSLAGLTSRQRMQRIRSFPVPADAFALWFLGQNGFLLKTPQGTLVAIDPYLSNSCGETITHLPYSLARTLPILIEPQHLDVDAILVTHSHADHLDEGTLRHLSNAPLLIGPWEVLERARAWQLPLPTQLLHAHQQFVFRDITLQGAFALPTDNTDLNHIGILCTLENGLTFYNTGDCAYAPILQQLLPHGVDVCAICINGAFHNLTAADAALLITTIAPRIVIPTHFDMMPCSLADPESFRIALAHQGSAAHYLRMSYDEPLLYQRSEKTA